MIVVEIALLNQNVQSASSLPVTCSVSPGPDKIGISTDLDTPPALLMFIHQALSRRLLWVSLSRTNIKCELVVCVCLCVCVCVCVCVSAGLVSWDICKMVLSLQTS